MIISVTLPDSIKPAVKLITQIRLEYEKVIPILIGGTAFSLLNQEKENKLNAYFTNNNVFVNKTLSLKDAIKSVDATLKIRN